MKTYYSCEYSNTNTPLSGFYDSQSVIEKADTEMMRIIEECIKQVGKPAPVQSLVWTSAGTCNADAF